MNKIILLLVGFFFLVANSCYAQPSRNVLVYKFDPLGGLFGELRFSFERKLSPHRYFFSSAGYYQREDKLDVNGNPVDGPSQFGNILRAVFKSPYNKFFYTSAGYFYKNYGFDREKLHGPIFRAGIKQYIKTLNAPEGAFVYLGIGYGLIRAQFYNLEYSLVHSEIIHKPGASFAIGHQWLWGMKDNWVISMFGGMEYYHIIRMKPNYDPTVWKNIPNFILYAGLEVGFSFRQKFRHW